MVYGIRHFLLHTRHTHSHFACSSLRLQTDHGRNMHGQRNACWLTSFGKKNSCHCDNGTGYVQLRIGNSANEVPTLPVPLFSHWLLGWQFCMQRVVMACLQFKGATSTVDNNYACDAPGTLIWGGGALLIPTAAWVKFLPKGWVTRPPTHRSWHQMLLSICTAPAKQDTFTEEFSRKMKLRYIPLLPFRRMGLQACPGHEIDLICDRC